MPVKKLQKIIINGVVYEKGKQFLEGDFKCPSQFNPFFVFNLKVGVPTENIWIEIYATGDVMVIMQ